VKHLHLRRALATGITVFVATISFGLIVPRMLFWALEEVARKGDGLQ